MFFVRHPVPYRYYCGPFRFSGFVSLTLLRHIFQVFQSCPHGVRVEQVQPDPLRLRQPAAEDCAGIQVQHLLSRPHRQGAHPAVHPHPHRQRGLLHPQDHLW
jgi:hypothetical protein